jgi:hypothetical protein
MATQRRPMMLRVGAVHVDQPESICRAWEARRRPRHRIFTLDLRFRSCLVFRAW